METGVDARPRVVVGVGESAASVAALAWARDLCRRRGWSLDIVSAWPDSGDVLVHEAPGHFCLPRDRVVSALNAALATTGVEIDGPGAGIHVENLDPLDALVAHARGARLLVVGESDAGRSRRAGFAPLSERCRALVDCPVAVVGAKMAA